MKKILWFVSSLTIIAGICAATLAYINDKTKTPIAEMKVKQAAAAAKAVMPEGVVKVEETKLGDESAYIGKDASGKTIALAFRGSDPGGYGGDIELMVGFTPDGKVVTYKALQSTETPGLGTKLASPEFYGQFTGKDALKPLSVTKDGGEIEAITSATITSRAVCRAVAAAAAKIAKLGVK